MQIALKIKPLVRAVASRAVHPRISLAASAPVGVCEVKKSGTPMRNVGESCAKSLGFVAGVE